jgi:hypothetical protein
MFLKVAGSKCDQVAWLTDELKNAPADSAVAVTMHHPTYSPRGGGGWAPQVQWKALR